MSTTRQAAEQRAAAVANRADRPTQRRDASPLWSAERMTVRARLEVRVASDPNLLTFEGWASTYESPYEMYDVFGPYTEVVTAGAGARSLNRSDLDVPLVLAHDQLRRIARTVNGTLILNEDDAGLHVLAPNLDPNDFDVAYIASKLRVNETGRSLIDEMSFAFRIQRGMWSPDWTEYRIDEYEIHRGDVAIVGFGANPTTSGALRSDLTNLGSRAEVAAPAAPRRALDELMVL